MIDENFEFRLTQYLDGSLPVDEAVAFFESLSKSPAAMAMLDEYRKLDLVLKAQSPKAINWDGLAEDISAQIDDESRSRLRIGFFTPLRSAMAAAVLLAVGIGSWFALQQPAGPAAPPVIAQISGPTIEIAAAPVVSQIEIGPASEQAVMSVTYHYADLLDRPSRVVIASGVVARQDERTLPY